MSSSTQSVGGAKVSGATLDKQSLFHQPISVWAVFFACITAFMGMGLVNPVLPSIAENLQASPSEVTLLYTSYNAVMAFAMLITSTVSSRLGNKGTLLAGVFIIATVSALGGFADNIWTLVGLRAGWGLGNALFVATALAAIVSLSSSGTAKAIILYEAAVGLGISIGPLLGGTLGSISWRSPFLGVSTLMILAFLILLVLMPKPTTQLAVKKKKAPLSAPFKAMKHRSLLVLGIVAALYWFFYDHGLRTICSWITSEGSRLCVLRVGNIASDHFRLYGTETRKNVRNGKIYGNHAFLICS